MNRGALVRRSKAQTGPHQARRGGGRRIDLLFPVLPPALDGIGDHTARLASSLQERGVHVRILTAESQATPVPGVSIETTFRLDQKRSLWRVLEAIRRDPPDWLVVQYNPFSYGRWGFNLHLPLLVGALKRRFPRVQIALMIHEPFVPIESWKMAVMTTWQRLQLWLLGRTADLVCFSIEPWRRRFHRWFLHKPVKHLPVSSNIPFADADRATVRARLGIDAETLVVGVFGGAHSSRLLHFIRAALCALTAEEKKLTVLYVGPAGARVRDALSEMPVIDVGPLPPEDVSRHFAAMDLYLSPFRKGVSTRRGSFMVGLQHGLATVSTHGVHTDAMLKEQSGVAFQLVPDDDMDAFRRAVLHLARHEGERARMGRAARQFFEVTLSWDQISRRLLKYLQEAERLAGSGQAEGDIPFSMMYTGSISATRSD